ncbi:restriction endonuclease [Streptomyces venezuelae]|uniref:restriction endonuclease n=1 Tax=Streptomyces venezuelae TaxID=54571 RepID=UPI00278BD40A|nr:restriction endonuclease [Streptomyces venezuelae]
MAASGGRERGTAEGGRAAFGRDVVLAVGLAGVVAGGAALFLRTVRAAGAHPPVMLIVLLLVLGVGAAMARWCVTPLRRPRGRGGDAGRLGHPQGWGREYAAVEEGTGEDVLEPVTGGAPVVAPVVDEEALDHDAADPYEFEHTVAALCARDGCTSVKVVGGAGDLGADVLATTADGLRVVIQCKRYAPDHRVGSPDLQRFGGTCWSVHEADVAALVTTSSFTDPALDYAASCGILCVDGTALSAWTASEAPAPWDALPPEPGEPAEARAEATAG